MAFGTMAARPGEPRLTPEVTGSPRRAGFFRLKSFEGPSEPGAKKLSKMTLLPLLFGIFRIPDQNVERSLLLCGNWCRTL